MEARPLRAAPLVLLEKAEPVAAALTTQAVKAAETAGTEAALPSTAVLLALAGHHEQTERKCPEPENTERNMTQLIPCPGCNRHVRQAETSCPFCATALSLEHIAPAALPRTRLGRAATFAFGATLVGATTLLACGGESEDKKPGGGGSSSGGTSSGGSNSNAGDQNFGGSGVVGPVYGAPAAGTAAIYGGPPIGGTGNDDQGGSGNSAGNTSGGTSVGGSGGPAPAYGAPTAGFSGVPLYGAAPAD